MGASARGQDALRTIVADPQLGVAALSSAQTMSNLLKDLLPDAPRETSVLVAAAEAGLAQTLLDHVGQGMDVATASSLAASAFAARAPFTTDACNWAVGELAVALGLARAEPPPGPAPAGPAYPGEAQADPVPGTKCPPPSGNAGGQTLWHSNVNSKYRQRAGQILECYSLRRPSFLLYLWTLPTQRVILVANDNATGATFADLEKWWSGLNYG